jgi:hypothetical protein
VKLLPKEYFGQVTSKVYNFRMRIDGDHRSLPCLDHIIFLLKNINEQKRDIFDISNNVYELQQNDERQKNMLNDIFQITKAFK